LKQPAIQRGVTLLPPEGVAIVKKKVKEAERDLAP
jgi:hypothetical protein